MYTAGNKIESGHLYMKAFVYHIYKDRSVLRDNMKRKNVPESNTQSEANFLFAMRAPFICMRFTFLSIMNSVQVDNSQLP